MEDVSSDTRARTGGRMRRSVVLHILPQDLNRGAQVYAGKLRDALRDDKLQQHLVVTLFEGVRGGARPDVALGISSGPLRRLVDPRAVRGLRKLVRDRAADALVAHGGEALKYAVAAAGACPTVYYKVGLSTAEIARPLHRRLYHFLSNRAALVVGNSNAILAQVTQVFGVPMSRQALIPNGRDPIVYRPLSDCEESASPPRVIFVGQLEAGKRPSLFLDIVEELRQAGHHFDAVVVGDGPLRVSLEGRSHALRVRLLGTRQDVPQLLRESAVLVMTSAPDTEGMPGVLIEAGLSQIPVVSTRAAGVADIIVDGATGWIVEDDPQLMAARVAKLLSDRSLRSAQGLAALERCRSRFALGATADQWRTLLERLIAGKNLNGGPPQEAVGCDG